jgi:hypothetical protein
MYCVYGRVSKRNAPIYGFAHKVISAQKVLSLHKKSPLEFSTKAIHGASQHATKMFPALEGARRDNRLSVRRRKVQMNSHY